MISINTLQKLLLILEGVKRNPFPDGWERVIRDDQEAGSTARYMAQSVIDRDEVLSLPNLLTELHNEHEAAQTRGRVQNRDTMRLVDKVIDALLVELPDNYLPGIINDLKNDLLNPDEVKQFTEQERKSRFCAKCGVGLYDGELVTYSSSENRGLMYCQNCRQGQYTRCPHAVLQYGSVTSTPCDCAPKAVEPLPQDAQQQGPAYQIFNEADREAVSAWVRLMNAQAAPRAVAPGNAALNRPIRRRP
jgi:hypothetical protein